MERGGAEIVKHETSEAKIEEFKFSVGARVYGNFAGSPPVRGRIVQQISRGGMHGYVIEANGDGVAGKYYFMEREITPDGEKK